MPSKISAIIVDDEERARNVLSSLLESFCPQVEVVGSCSGVEEAVEAIDQHQAQVVFLDIEMPNYAGYEIVEFFGRGNDRPMNFEIIFVTAYDRYAVKAFQLAAVDYLLKPIEVDRLKEAVEKVAEKLADKQVRRDYQHLVKRLQHQGLRELVVAHKGGKKVLDVEEIIAIEARESYCDIHTTSGLKILVAKNLKRFEGLLGDHPLFFRSHKSWLVNLKQVERYSKSKGEIMLKGNLVARLSKYRKAEFEKGLQNRSNY